MSIRGWNRRLRSSLRNGLLVLALVSLVLPAAPALAQTPDGGVPPAAYLPLINQGANGDSGENGNGDLPSDVWGEIAGDLYTDVWASVGTGV